MKKILVVVFFDLQKVFDTFKHDILLSKLEINDLRPLANEWFKSSFRQIMILNLLM